MNVKQRGRATRFQKSTKRTGCPVIIKLSYNVYDLHKCNRHHTRAAPPEDKEYRAYRIASTTTHANNRCF